MLFKKHLQAYSTNNNFFVSLQIGNPKMVVQSTASAEAKVVELDTAPFIDGDYTLVPLRAAAEALEAEVLWIGETNTVEITT